MKKLVSILLLLFSFNVYSDDFFKLSEVSIEYKKFLDGSRDPLINDNGLIDRTINEQLDLNVNVSIAKYLFFNNRVHSLTDKDINTDAGSRYRIVGWNYNLGAHINKYIDIGFEHFSQHELDATFPWPYPDTNSVNIKIYLYRSNDCSNCIF